MHELFRGFARSPAFNTCHQIENGNPPNSSEHIRHLSIWCQVIEKHLLNTITKHCKRLKTFLLLPEKGTYLHQISESFFTELHYLRVVNLSNSLITSLPRSIRNLKHLRYQTPQTLDFIPRTINYATSLDYKFCGLRNAPIYSLPQGIGKLVNLIFLEVDLQRLSYLPPHLGSLIHLRYLEEFRVEMEGDKHISELENLNNLRGSLRIKGLENVNDGLEATKANLIQKPHLKDIELHWTKMSPARNSLVTKSKIILTALEPHEGLQELKLMCYSGLSLPNWFTNPTRDIKKIHLYDCPKIENLTLFWQLPYLNTLFIDTLPNLKQVNRTFIGDANSERFVSLECRNMENLSSWEEMVTGDFPRLLYVTIMNCPQLKVLPTFQYLPKPPTLEISRCAGRNGSTKTMISAR